MCYVLCFPLFQSTDPESGRLIAVRAVDGRGHAVHSLPLPALTLRAQPVGVRSVHPHPIRALAERSEPIRSVAIGAFTVGPMSRCDLTHGSQRSHFVARSSLAFCPVSVGAHGKCAQSNCAQLSYLVVDL